MNNLKKYAAALAVALIAGFGIFGIVTAINAQTENNQKRNVQSERKDSENKLNESEENEASENEADENENGEEADENRDGEENDSDERAEQAKLAQEAAVTREQAEAVALGRIPGKVVKGEIEKENGKLLWSFDVRGSQDGQMFDVEVDANTGEVLKAQPDDDDENGGEESETADAATAK